MNIENVGGYTLKDLRKINVVLGKNGCGKSTMLRQIEQGLTSQGQVYGKSRYITPERGGTLIYTSGVEEAISKDINWMPVQRRKNLSDNFRQQSVAQYRKLETLILRAFEQDQSKTKFEPYIDKINSLLDNIEIKRDELTFKIFKKGTTDELNAGLISSGESELISLGIELLIFGKESDDDKENILFLDEPDVHLHPDLQMRLMNFLINIVTENNFRIIIATHSTAILGALGDYENTSISFMSFGAKEINFKPIRDTYKKILPIFGAHPLSNFFNEAPILLVEGEDDERIWQQVVRSSSGNIKLYPCHVGSITKLNEHELAAQSILNSIYNDAVGYSLRDRDESDENIENLNPIVRMKLSCRNAENLLLTDEVLDKLGTTWDDLKNKINDWLAKYKDNHDHYDTMKAFCDSGYNRKSHDLKEIRNDLMFIMGSPKPWEIVVGQTIASLNIDAQSVDFNDEGKIYSFLGKKVVDNMLNKSSL
jgi:energy-coupling factor transporter ATP-binding protein EcfA2